MTGSSRTPKRRSRYGKDGLTPRQSVLAKYPYAQWIKATDTGNWIINTGYPKYARLGTAASLREAWRVAAERMNRVHI